MEREYRRWQREALKAWIDHKFQGIVSVVTGGGKTYFALACIEEAAPKTALVVVPTLALVDQWWEEAASFFGLRLDEVNIVTGNRSVRTGTVNIAVLNTAARLAEHRRVPPVMLVVDECHKAASTKFRAALDVPKVASLGLSATPERPYDEGLTDVLVPALGPVLYEYSYADALRDKVIVPFDLNNVVFDLEPDRLAEYERLTRGIAVAMDRHGAESSEVVGLLLKRSRVLNLSPTRVAIALKIIASHRGKRTLVFHEDIESAEVINEVLRAHGVPSAVYHSAMPLAARAAVLQQYRSGVVSVLISCRALDEGFNVPETEIGIIAAGTATRRQRIQRLGRVLRPTLTKDRATIYTIVASGPEIARLKAEEEDLDGVASVTWSSA